MSERFRDPGIWTELLWDHPVLVRCPSCGHAATVAPRPAENRSLDWRDAQPRLTCPACAYTAASRDTNRSYRIGGPVDPFFGADLLLQAECVGHILWAYNEHHLELIAAYVRAPLRERADFTDLQHQTMLEKLPRWLKEAKHREDVGRSVGRLRALVPTSPGP